VKDEGPDVPIADSNLASRAGVENAERPAAGKGGDSWRGQLNQGVFDPNTIDRRAQRVQERSWVEV
jgi:hypothetical protein